MIKKLKINNTRKNVQTTISEILKYMKEKDIAAKGGRRIMTRRQALAIGISEAEEKNLNQNQKVKKF